MISKELYEFLVCELNCPYDGKIKGVGEAYSHLVVTKDTTPNTLETNVSGDFYQPNYISVVAPSRNVHDDEIAQKILEQIVKQRSDGKNDVWDADRQRTLHFGNNITSRIDVSGNNLSIDISDSDGNRYQYSTDDIEAYVENLGNSISGTQVGFDVTGLLFDASEYSYGKLKTSKKSDIVNKGKKILKKNGINIKTKNSVIYKQKIPSFYKTTGRVLFVASAVFMATDIVSNKAVRTSNAVDAAMLGVAFIPGYGWAVAGGYFLIDLGLMYFTGNSIGDYANDLSDAIFSTSDGIIIDLEPAIDWIEESWDSFWNEIDLPDLMY